MTSFNMRRGRAWLQRQRELKQPDVLVFRGNARALLERKYREWMAAVSAFDRLWVECGYLPSEISQALDELQGKLIPSIGGVVAAFEKFVAKPQQNFQALETTECTERTEADEDQAIGEDDAVQPDAASDGEV